MPAETSPLVKQFEQFAQCTSHTLSDPVRQMLALCEQQPDSAIADIEQNAKHLLEVIKRLRSYSFYLLQPPYFSQVTAQQLMDGAIKLLEERGVDGIDRIAVEEVAEASLTCDEIQVTEALYEMLVNALKFSNPQTPVRVQCHHSDSVLRFSIADQGRGVDEIYQPRIFTMSVRGDNVAGIEGEGIGLAVVQAVADNHQGSVSVQSELTKGSVFQLSIQNMESKG